MKIFITAKPGARKAEIKKLDDAHYTVSVTALPLKGLANAAITKALARYFGVASGRVRLASGHTSRQKIFDVS